VRCSVEARKVDGRLESRLLERRGRGSAVAAPRGVEHDDPRIPLAEQFREIAVPQLDQPPCRRLYVGSCALRPAARALGPGSNLACIAVPRVPCPVCLAAGPRKVGGETALKQGVGPFEAVGAVDLLPQVVHLRVEPLDVLRQLADDVAVLFPVLLALLALCAQLALHVFDDAAYCRGALLVLPLEHLHGARLHARRRRLFHALELPVGRSQLLLEVARLLLHLLYGRQQPGDLLELWLLDCDEPHDRGQQAEERELRELARGLGIHCIPAPGGRGRGRRASVPGLGRHCPPQRTPTPLLVPGPSRAADEFAPPSRK